MLKKVLGILSLVLAMVLLLGVFPATETAAVQSEEYRLTQQVEEIYKQALKATKRYSFRGYCGAAVDWQVYQLGIISKVIGANGNDQFDMYRYSNYSTGGYRINAYSSRNYTLKSALNAITENGTKDAYNLIVGFQKTNTSAGQKYGHALFIHGIIDGIVYFTESYNLTINGKTYPEGKCVAVTIDQFCKSYNSWTTFDGVICFGLKTYTDVCEYYASYLYASVAEETVLYSAPCTPDVDDSSTALRTLQPGERVQVVGMYCNPAGEYWYQVEDYQTGYVLANHTVVQDMRYDDVNATGIAAPSVHLQGNTYNVKGVVSSTYNTICSVRAQVFTVTGGEMTHKMTATAVVSDNYYSLSYSTVSNRLAFRLLGVGSYHYELAAVVSNNYIADGQLQTEWKTIKLYAVDFQVVYKKGSTVTVKYDPNGGSSTLNAAELSQGQTINTLPEATRDGFTFEGWYTAAEGGEKVEEDYILTGNVTFYARWSESLDATGWYTEDGQPYYILDGQRIAGFFQVDGITYYQQEDGFLHTGWLEFNDLRYFFNVNGSMVTGWLEIDGCFYYFGDDGTAYIGWAEVDGHTYYFTEDGRLTGEQEISGQKYTFSESGILTH